MNDSRATIYVAEFGEHNSHHIIIADFDSYLDRRLAREAFDDFSDPVEDCRDVVSVQWYRRVAARGD